MRHSRRSGFAWLALPQVVMGLLVWAVLSCAGAFAADEAYIVKRGDSLYTIARSHGVSTAVIAERNGLGRNPHIYAGQRLTIPASSGSRKAASSADASAKSAARPLPRSIQRAIEKASVRPGRWQYIVVHHSDVDTGTMKAMDNYHREVRHMENGLAYHFVIGNGSGMGDGEIGVSRRWTQQLDGGHLASESQNKVAIGICLVGNFDQHAPTRKEMESLRALVAALMARCHLTPEAVKTHQQINIVRTRCPGTKFPTRSFLDSLKPPRG